MIDLILLASVTAATPQPAAPAEPCAAAPYHAFDFVTGNYELFDEAGKKIADERVASEMGGCFIHEYFKASTGDPAESFSFYDPVERSWFQYAFGLHLVFRVKGGVENGTMLLEGTSTHIKTGAVRPFRISWTPLPDGNVAEQLVERDPASNEWKTIFSGKLVRTKSQDSGVGH